MDQPFESDVMEDLASDTPTLSADEFDQYEGMDEESFDENEAFTDEMDEFAEESVGSFEDYAFEDNLDDDLLEGDLWDDYSGETDEFNPHQTNLNQASRTRHQKGNRRRRMDRRGEAGVDLRRPARRRPPEYNEFDAETDVFSDEFEEFEDEFDRDSGDQFADDAVNAIDAMEEAIADALEAEDSDEFLRRVTQGIRRASQIARQVGRGVGQVARVVGPVARMIPVPQAQAIGAIANIAGRLLADGADEFEALEEILAFAEEENAVDAAAPIIAGLTVRTIMPRASRLNRSTRRQLVRSVRQSTQTLARRQGASAVRAVPRVVQAVQRTAQRRRVPAQQLPQAVRRATTTVVRNPRLVSRLARATQHASAVTHRYSTRTNLGATQRLVIRGPVEITIRSR